MNVQFGLWRNKLLLVALTFFFVHNSSYLRVALRSLLEGSSFRWGYESGLYPDGRVMFANGIGLYGDLGYLTAHTFSVVLLLIMGLRKPDGLFRAALLVWTGLSVALYGWIVLVAGHTLTQSRETIGQVEAPVDLSVLIWPGAAFVSALALFARDLGRSSSVSTPMLPVNWLLLAAAAMAISAAGVVLNLGAQHGQADFAGMSLIYVSLMLLVAGLAPWTRSDSPS